MPFSIVKIVSAFFIVLNLCAIVIRVLPFLKLLIDSLINRVKKNSVKEVILATSASIEGETTSHYISDSLKDEKVKITRLAKGVPVGGEIEFLDDGTLFSAFKNRKPVANG